MCHGTETDAGSIIPRHTIHLRLCSCNPGIVLTSSGSSDSSDSSRAPECTIVDICEAPQVAYVHTVAEILTTSVYYSSAELVVLHGT